MWKDLEILQGDPLDKWKEIIFHADRKIVQKELDRLLELLAFFEILMGENGLESELEKKIKAIKVDELLQKKIKNYKNNFAIASMAEILSQNE
ncbi:MULTISPECIES: DUF2018 family protein [unclassified Helicobacter]|uniref:DUF2018 family protein n=1 Tax=unclassified Helicobacter TaxID=2593540 RepID=UPI000CF09646|nr:MULTISPECIES: DUF2018 family protein [unclassified Helicobacter]